MTQRLARPWDPRVPPPLPLRSLARCAVLLAALLVILVGARQGAAGESLHRLPAALPEIPYSAPSETYAEPYRVSPYGGGSGGGEPCCDEPWTFQVAPSGLIYRSYLAGVKEPRLGSTLNYERNQGWVWDLAIGARVGLFRYGTTDDIFPDGWQLDVEGGAFLRLDPEEEMDLEGTDYRFGIPLSYGCGRYQMKIAYFHLSSHLGDEFAIRNGLGGRINYSRDSIVWGHSYFLSDELRVYGEIEYAFFSDISEPWHAQFGAEYSTLYPTGARGAPFAAVNAQLREEVNFGGNLVIQAGWQWTGDHDARRIRLGIQYYNGQHERYQFFRTSEQKIGLGVWYDF